MTEIRDCPHCGASDSLETFLRIDLDDVAVDAEKNIVTSFTLAGSANDPSNGVVVEEARVSCRECGAELEEAYVPHSFTDRWLYYDRPMPAIEVYVATIHHRHGENVYVTRSREGAVQQVADYCHEWWESGENEPEDRDELIEAYFEDHEDEWASIEAVTLEEQ